MEQTVLEQLKNKNSDQILNLLEHFNKTNANLFDFTKFHNDDLWFQLWKALFGILKDSSLSSLYPLCLNTVRIFTRDAFSLQNNNVIEDLDCIIKLAHLSEHLKNNDNAAATGSDETAAAIIIEALKCLCNLVFQSTECRRHCVKKNVVDFIFERVASFDKYPSTMEFYDMKLLFLLTALDSTARNRVQIELNGITYMTQWLDDKLTIKPHDDELLDIMSEILKILFNITTSPDKSPNENEIQSLHLTCVLRGLLLRFDSMNSDRERNVVTQVINLLTNFSSCCLTELVVKYERKNNEAAQVHVYEGRNVRVLDVLLNYLRAILEEQENAAASGDLIPPVLTVLVKCARCHPVMRHYIRSVILPPLRDVSKRPEVGNELRNHLCRFLTLPAMLVRDLTAELLFICCKENVGRMIKYTGYGNAAGLFASRGILDCRRVENTNYSSDSEDSDTEEYKRLQHGINPVLGCYEPPKKDPLEGMSEEQKEYEAMELVKLMDKLHKGGIVQPCIVGEDGKPYPVEHIAQLQEELPQQQLEQKRKT